MEFHLCTEDGQRLGVFTLEDLHSRRTAGSLNGRELVWREGMPEWQNLDAVLRLFQPQQPTPNPPATRPPRASVLVPLSGAAGVILSLVVMAMVWNLKSRSSNTTKSRPDIAASKPALLDEASGEGRLAVELAGKPIVWNDKTRTEKDWNKLRGTFLERQYLDGYKKNGIRNPETDADSILLLESWLADTYGVVKVETALVSKSVLAEKLAVNPKCTDPVVLLIASFCIPELRSSVAALERSVRGFEKSNHTPYPRYYASIRLGEVLYKDKSDRLPVLDSTAIQAFRDMLNGGTLLPGDDEMLSYNLLDGELNNFFHRNSERLIKIARSNGVQWKWLSLVFEGDLAINEAWRSRGGGTVSSVTEKGWEGFARHLGYARKCLTEAWKLQPGRPLAPARMIRVAMGDSGTEEMRLWFDRTVVAQIDYLPGWNQFAFGLYPRWHGNLPALLALGKMAAATKRFDTDVPRQLLGIITRVERELELPPRQRILGRSDIWPSVQEMFEGYLKEPGPDTSRRKWHTTYSVAAYQAKKYPIARDQLAACDWKPDTTALQGWKTDLSILDLEVAARTGPLGANISDAESRVANGDLGDALKIFTQLKSNTNADSRTRAFIEDRLITLGIAKKLESGNWVDFLPSDNQLRGWSVQRGAFTRKPDGAIEATSDHLGHAMYARVPMGVDFEVRGELETVRSSTDAFQGGLVIGLPHINQTGWNALRLKRNPVEGDVVSYSRGWTKAQIYKSYVLNDQVNKFEFRFRTNMVSMTLNGTTLFTDATPIENRDLSTSEIYLGIGAFNEMNETVMRYKRLEVRKIRK